MTKKDEAFGLFSQGKMPDSSDVMALGLKKESVRRYFRLWEEQNQVSEPILPPEPIIIPSKPAEMPVGSLPDGSLFEHRGQTYKRQRVLYGGKIVAHLMVKAHYTTVLTQKESHEFSPDIIVKPI